MNHVSVAIALYAGVVPPCSSPRRYSLRARAPFWLAESTAEPYQFQMMRSHCLLYARRLGGAWSLLAAAALAFAPAVATARTWTDQTGTRIEAELAGVEGGNALLQKGGQTFRVPIATLSADDQVFIRSWNPAASKMAPAASSSTAKPKKGFCLASNKSPDWADRLRSLNVSWFYQWKAEMTAGAPEAVEFVPMVFGKPNSIASSVEYVLGAKKTAGFNYLLGYNEPDKADQSNMTVEAALDTWPQLMSAGLPLISPAPANPEGEWLEAFMAGAKQRGFRVDFIAIHSYGGPSAAAFLEKLERVHRKYDLPLWITEFAVGDWEAKAVAENRHSAKSIKDFMQAVLPKLDRLKYVHRYAWFSASPTDPHLGTSALFNDDGSLTELGEVYAKH
jgi:hypothetical protein